MQDPELVNQLKERLPEALYEKLNGSLSIDRDRLRFARLLRTVYWAFPSLTRLCGRLSAASGPRGSERTSVPRNPRPAAQSAGLPQGLARRCRYPFLPPISTTA